jgi:sugar phosphate permease
MREKIEKVILWASMIIGLLVIGACTTAGGKSAGIPGAFAGFFGGAIVATILLGWIYAYFVLRRDLKSIHAEIAKLRSGSPEDP